LATRPQTTFWCEQIDGVPPFRVVETVGCIGRGQEIVSGNGASPERRPQLPAQNLGRYPKYVIAAGTRLRIQQRPGGNWRSHTTRRVLTFDKATHSRDDSLWFEYECWKIWVRREDVKAGRLASG
jgi:hypothetical protein